MYVVVSLVLIALVKVRPGKIKSKSGNPIIVMCSKSALLLAEYVAFGRTKACIHVAKFWRALSVMFYALLLVTHTRTHPLLTHSFYLREVLRSTYEQS